MVKRILVVFVILICSLGLLSSTAQADKGYDAVLTIDANKNDVDNGGTLVYLKIGMSEYEAYYNEQGYIVMGGQYTGFVEDGQIIGSGSERVLIKTIPKKEEPKPEPKPEPKDPKPEPKPEPKDPKPEPKPKPKQDSQPKPKPKDETKSEQKTSKNDSNINVIEKPQSKPEKNTEKTENDVYKDNKDSDSPSDTQSKDDENEIVITKEEQDKLSDDKENNTEIQSISKIDLSRKPRLLALESLASEGEEGGDELNETEKDENNLMILVLILLLIIGSGGLGYYFYKRNKIKES